MISHYWRIWSWSQVRKTKIQNHASSCSRSTETFRRRRLIRPLNAWSSVRRYRWCSTLKYRWAIRSANQPVVSLGLEQPAFCCSRSTCTIINGRCVGGTVTSSGYEVSSVSTSRPMLCLQSPKRMQQSVLSGTWRSVWGYSRSFWMILRWCRKSSSRSMWWASWVSAMTISLRIWSAKPTKKTHLRLSHHSRPNQAP